MPAHALEVHSSIEDQNHGWAIFKVNISYPMEFAILEVQNQSRQSPGELMNATHMERHLEEAWHGVLC